MLPDLAGKKPRLWLWIPTLLKHPLRYRNSQPLSRWRKGNFLGPGLPRPGRFAWPLRLTLRITLLGKKITPRPVAHFP